MKIILWILLGLLAAALGIVLILLLVLTIIDLFVDTKNDYTKEHPLYRFYIDLVCWGACFFGRCKIHVTGLEHIPAEGRFLFVSNHRSNYDPLVAMTVLKKYHLSFVSKAGNFHIPLAGPCIHRCCFLEIDREDPRKAIRTINAAADLLKNDEVSVGIYPEGTRSKDCVLLPFHDGVFKIAQKAKVPVVVSTIRGTENIHKNFPWKRTEIYMDILDCIYEPETIKTSVLAAKVREEFEESLAKEIKD